MLKIFRRCFAFFLAFSLYQTSLFAWWGRDNNYSYRRDNDYEPPSWSFNFNSRSNHTFTYDSTDFGQSYISARTNFFHHPLYECKVRVESSNPGFTSFVAPTSLPTSRRRILWRGC